MAKTKISEYDSTAANNTDIDGINIAEGCAPSGINNAIREQMAHLKDGLGAGTPVFLDQTNNRLGVGTTSPQFDLHIHQGDSTNSLVQFTNSTTGSTSNDGLLVGLDSAEQAQIWFRENSVLRLATNDTERMRIDGSGNVGIGNSSPSYLLSLSSASTTQAEIKSTATNGTAQIRFTNDARTYTQGVDNNDNFFLFDATGAASRLTVDTSGNVGIGTSSPSSLLTLHGSQPIITLSDPDSTSTSTISGNSGHLFLNADSGQGFPNSIINFTVDNDTKMRIDSSGNVMIGGTNGNPVGNHVSQIIGNGTTGLGVHRDGGTPFKIGTDGNRAIQIMHINGADVGSIDVSGSSTSYNTSSDYRLKENVTDLTNGITRLKQLSPKRFNFIKEPDITLDGFLAHEAQAVVPEASNYEKDATRTVNKGVYNSDGIVIFEDIEEQDWKSGKETTKDEEGNTINGKYPSDSTWSASKEIPVYQGMDATKLVPLLTAALQETIAKIETLETKVAALEG